MGLIGRGAIGVLYGKLMERFLSKEDLVYIVDETGIVDSLKAFIKRWLNVKSSITLKPLDCSLCMTHWVCLAYVLIFYNISIFVYLYILFLSCNTDNIYAMIQKVNELISKFTN